MTFKIEKIRKHLVSPPAGPAPTLQYYEHWDCGFLVTGYADGGDWLVSPLGRRISGYAFKHAPDFGWAYGADPRMDYQRPHLYILDFHQKAIREIEGLALTREAKIIGEYDGRHLIVIVPLTEHDAPFAEDKWTREVIAIDIGSAEPVNRFRTKGIAFHFHDPIAQTPDGWLKFSAHGHDPKRDCWAPGFIRIHPLASDFAFEAFPRLGHEKLTISPSGRYVLRANLARLPVRDLGEDHVAPADFDGKKRRYARSVQLWSGAPLAYQRDLTLGWASVEGLRFLPGDNAVIRANLDEIAALCEEPRADPLSAPAKTANKYTETAELRTLAETHWKFAELPLAPLVWQGDETAFWWNYLECWSCVGLDGEISSPVFLKERVVSFVALPNRKAEVVVELGHGYACYVLDGSPSADPCVVRDAPVATPLTTDGADDERQWKAQAALTKLVESSTELRVVVPSLQLDDCIRAIDAMTMALGRGLTSFTNKDKDFKVRVEAAGGELDEERFFSHVESLGPAVAPALSRLVEKCCADPDMWTVWSLEEEDACQAFGAAANALGAVDAGAWLQLAKYFMYVDEWHEAYFQCVTEPHFVEKHGWCEESFNLALSVMVQVRGNLGDSYAYAWKDRGLAAAAEDAYTPAEFAARMLAVRDRILASAAGPFAKSKRVASFARGMDEQRATYGWPTYDDLFEQIRVNLTPWEVRLFEELKRRSR